MSIAVVVAPEVIVAGAVRIDADLLQFPAVPPPTGRNTVDVLGTFVRDTYGDFRLVLSADIVVQSIQAVATIYDFDFEHREQLLGELSRLVHLRGGVFVRPESGIQFPSTMDAGARATLECAAAQALGHPRTVIVVTENEKSLRGGNWRPAGIAWDRESHVQILSPHEFNAFVEEVRRRRRP
ncbi:MAG TPA: hypothetical protein PLG60_07485 [Acidimicrobiales bacterium]|nr:hypothetical protein [Acidimicrobiales bacterium]